MASATPTTPLIVGFDPGNSQSTIAVRNNGKVQFFTIPSYIGAGDLIGYLATQRGSGATGGLTEDEYAIALDGATWFAGNLALKQVRAATSMIGSLDRYTNGHTTRLLLALLGKIIKQTDEAMPIRVVTGLPIKFARDEIKRSVRRALCQTYHYQWCGKIGNRPGTTWLGRAVTIEAVAVLMEGAATLHQTATEEVDQVVVDAGGGTLDLYWAYGPKPRYELCRSFDDCGIDMIGEHIRRTVRQTHGRLLTDDEIKRIMYAHAHRKPQPRITVLGQDIMLNGEITSAISVIANDQLARVRSVWEDSDGKVAAPAAYARLIGGGAYFLGDHYKTAIDHITVPERPELENALAYLLVGEAADESAWKRNTP